MLYAVVGICAFWFGFLLAAMFRSGAVEDAERIGGDEPFLSEEVRRALHSVEGVYYGHKPVDNSK